MAALLALAACSDDGAGSGPSAVDPSVAVGLQPGQINTFKEVDTALSAAKTKAGSEVTVTCTAQPGNVKIPKPTFVVTPADGLKVAGAALKAERAGTYNVACTLNNVHKLTDVSPAQLVVVAGPAATIHTAVAPAKLASGDKFLVTCTGKDAFGNAVGKDDDKFSAEADPPELAKLDGALGGEGQKAGKGLVRCKLPDMAANAVVNAADLEVTPGTPVKTVATVTPGEIVAGEAGAEVKCAAYDAYGNPTSGDFTLDVPAGLTIAGTKLTGTKAGSYEVKCALPDVSDKQAAKLVVVPAPAVAWKMGVTPDQKVYKAEETIKTVALEEDKYGNVTKVAIESGVTVAPADMAKANGGGKSWDLLKDGYVTFTWTHPTLKTAAGSPSDSVKIKVDSTGPLVYIATPKRGETRDGDADVAVKGTVADELSALKSFVINGKQIKVGGDGSYAYVLSSVQGMNVILWEALDEHDNKSSGVQTYYYSTKWYPNDTTKPAEAHVTSGIGFWMSQDTIDAGPPHNHTNPKDLASVAEIVIGTMDLKSLVGGAPIAVNQGINGVFTVETVDIKSVTFGDKGINGGYPELGFTVITGGMHIKAKIHNLNIVLRMNVKTFGAAGWQEFLATSDWVNIETDLMLALDPKTKKVTSSLKNTKIKIQDFKVKLGANSLPNPLDKLVAGAVNLLLDIVQNLLGGAITGLIEQVLQDQIQKQLGAALGKAFENLALNTELPLKPFIGKGEEVKVKLNSALGLLTFKAGEGVLAGLDGSMTAPKKVAHEVLGSIGRAGCLMPKAKDIFNPSLKYALEVGLADDFVNQLLHALWNGGLLQMSIGAEALGSVDLSTYGVSDLSIKTDFLLQPMINTCLAKDGSLKLQVGDLKLNAKLKLGETPIDLWMYVTLQATAELKAVDNPTTKQKEIGFALKGIEIIEMEITEINAEAKGLKGVFVMLIKTLMVPKLLEGLGSGLGGFPLPELDLSALSPSIPKNTKLAIEVQAIVNDGGYTYLKGKVK
ncbi:MAG: hypothetical protein FJ100_17485 [Deltaproteobacteria bacterium]|nr:hypothetical protein [Deltaproteobacteria bacterium]